MTTSAGHAVAAGRDNRGDAAWALPRRRAAEPLPAAVPASASSPTFEELYASQYARMVRLAHSLVDTRTRAEEVVQDAFAAVYERFDRVTNPTAYLRTCVLNGCRRVIRRRMLRRARPFATVDSAELTYNHVLDAIRRLPHKQRSMIALRYDLQLTDAEIAATLGVPLGTVKSTLYRALTALRQEIQE
jgi:RNA polymerase sigma factor (sigma-70 family)